MIIDSEITRDIETALEVLTSDTSATWMNAAVSILEAAAFKIREATYAEFERKRAAKPATHPASVHEAS